TRGGPTRLHYDGRGGHLGLAEGLVVIRRMLAVTAVLFVAAPVRAANKDIERLYIQVAALQSQVADLQRVTEDSLKEVRRLNEVLAEQNAALRRGVEEQRLREEAFQTALRDFTERLAEMGERLDAARAAAASVYTPTTPSAPGAAPGAPPGPAAPAPAAGVPPPRELYSQAYTDYARGNYDLAIQGYQEYLRNYPDTEFADNAQYWIGECLYSKQKYAEALAAWDELFQRYPSSDKLPDARLKKGLALERLGRRREALREYRFVVDRYPNTEAARKARDKIGAP
ncbi:MAG TPA: tol-pal system protein YbgF, partial [Vicinamibacteria bacterium]|nr:tol-pal system protein YbgF [Vicinamibacteria bacterium]